MKTLLAAAGLTLISAISAQPISAQQNVSAQAALCVALDDALLRLTCFDRTFARGPVPATREGPGVEIDDVTSKLIAVQAAACWTPPVGNVPASVRLSVRMTPEGSIVGAPEILDSATSQLDEMFNDSAREAIADCGPYPQVTLGQTTTVVVTMSPAYP